MYYKIAIATLVAGIAAILLTLVPVPDAVTMRGVDAVDRELTETYDRARLIIQLLNQKTDGRPDVIGPSALHLHRLLEGSKDTILRESAPRLLARNGETVNPEVLALVCDRASTLAREQESRILQARDRNTLAVRAALAIIGTLFALVGAGLVVVATRNDRFELKACEMALPPGSGTSDKLSFRILRLEMDRKRMARDLLSFIDHVGSLRMRVADLSEQLSFDDLTNLFTARGLLEAMDPVFDRFLASREPFSLLAIDLDLFKQVNSYGHEEGDRALDHYADGLRAVLGPTPLAARPSGDEFLAVIPGPEADLLEVIDRLREFYGSNPFIPAVDGARPITLRATYGYVCIGDVGLPLLGPEHSARDRRTQFGFLIHYGDKALTHAKHTERGSVHKYDPDRKYKFGAGILPRGVGNAYSLIERNIYTAWEKLDTSAQQLLSQFLYRAARLLVPHADLDPVEDPKDRSNEDDDAV